MARYIDADALNIIKEKLRTFDSFISDITRPYTDEHCAIYEHWLDCKHDIETVINNQPTAFDKDKVIDEMLEELQEVIDEHGERYVMMYMKERAKQMKEGGIDG